MSENSSTFSPGSAEDRLKSKIEAVRSIEPEEDFLKKADLSSADSEKELNKSTESVLKKDRAEELKNTGVEEGIRIRKVKDIKKTENKPAKKIGFLANLDKAKPNKIKEEIVSQEEQEALLDNLKDNIDLQEAVETKENEQEKTKDSLGVIKKSTGKNSKQYRDAKETLEWDKKQKEQQEALKTFDESPKENKEDLDKKQKEIEIITPIGSGGRKIDEKIIKENKQFISRENQIKDIKEKKENKKLLSSREAVLLREEELLKGNQIEKKDENNIVKKRVEEDDFKKNPETEMTFKGAEVESTTTMSEKSTNILKNEVDELFEKALGAKEILQKIKNKRSIFNKARNVLLDKTKILKNPNTGIHKEFKNAEEDFEKAQTEYRKKYQEFANKIIAEKKLEIEQKEGIESKRVASSEKLVEGTERNLEGQLEKMTIFEHIKQNEEKLLAERIENLDEKQKGLFIKMKDKYSNLPKAAKFGLGFVSSIGIGAGAGAITGVGIAHYLGYKVLKKKFIKKVAMWVGVGAVVGGAHRILKQDTALFKEDSKNKAEKNITESLETGRGDIFKALDQYNQQVRRKEQREKYLIGGLAFSTGALLGSFDLDEIKDALDGGAEIQGQGEVVLENTSQLENNLSSETNERGVAIDSEVPGNLEVAEQSVPEEPITPVTEDRGGSMSDGVNDNHLDEQVIESSLLNQSFELEKNGNVWTSLSEHFNGDRQKVGNVLAEFKKETVADLMREHNMNEARAKDFVEWRYTKMAVGTDFSLENGKLEIPDFSDDDMLKKFDIDKPVIVENSAVETPGVTRVGDVDQEIYDHSEGRNRMVDRIKQEDLYDNVNDLKVEEPVTEQELKTQAEMEVQDQAKADYEAQIDRNVENAVNKRVSEVYKHWFGDQREEWDIMRNKMAGDILDKKYGEPIGNQLDQVEINNRVQLRDYLVELISKTKEAPQGNETVEQFIKRAERIQHLK